MSFLRRKRDHEDAADSGVPDVEPSAEATSADDVADDGASTDAVPTNDAWPTGEKARPTGPFDVDDIDVDDTLTRLDFGALRVPAIDGMEVRLDVDDAGHVGAVAIVLQGTALQLQVFAAPRSGGLWDEIRTEMLAGIGGADGQAEESTGPFGPELLAQLPSDPKAGDLKLEPVRFLGVDGPRWFLRGVITGPGGADVAKADVVHQVFRNTVVVRGDAAAPPRELLMLTMPEDPALRADQPGSS